MDVEKVEDKSEMSSELMMIQVVEVLAKKSMTDTDQGMIGEMTEEMIEEINTDTME